MRSDVTRALAGVAAASIRTGFLHIPRPTMRSLYLPRRFGGSPATSNADGTNNITPCDIEPEIRAPPSPIRSVNLLRNAILSDANGTAVRLGDRMGPNTSIVVFLRHLA